MVQKKMQFIPHHKQCLDHNKQPYRITVYAETHTLCGYNAEFWSLQQVVHELITALYSITNSMLLQKSWLIVRHCSPCDICGSHSSVAEDYRVFWDVMLCHRTSSSQRFKHYSVFNM